MTDKDKIEILNDMVNNLRNLVFKKEISILKLKTKIKLSKSNIKLNGELLNNIMLFPTNKEQVLLNIRKKINKKQTFWQKIKNIFN